MFTKTFNAKKYAGLATLMMAGFIQHAEGQIIYTDVDPDIMLDPDGTGTLPTFIFMNDGIDLDEDFISDFSFNANYAYYIPSYYSYLVKRNIVNIKPIGLNEVAILTGTPDVFRPAEKFNMGDEINADNIWNKSVPFVLNGWLADVDLIDNNELVDDWINVDFTFAALRIKSGANYKYGWARLSVGANADYVILHDFALENTVNTPIIAGNTGDCTPPSTSLTTNISSTSAKLHWAPVFGASKYQIRYRKIGDPLWITVTAGAGATAKNITGLACNSNYEWKIKSKCGAEFSDFSNTHTFTTASCRVDFDANADATDVLIYPNPSNGLVTINLEGINNISTEICLIDLSGKMIQSTTVFDNQVELDYSNLAKGFYILQITNGEKVITKKLIIE